MSYRIRVESSDREFECDANETVLDAALRQGFSFPYSCRNGTCGSCKGKIRKGKVEYREDVLALSAADKKAKKALFCRAYPLSDLTVDVREVGAAREIPKKNAPCRVEKIEDLAPDVKRIYLKLPKSDRLQFLAGQYIDILMPDGARRSFSLANAPHDDALLELHIRFVEGGEYTAELLKTLKVKSLLRIEGPQGKFYFHENSTRPLIFMAGGTGFAPVKSMVEHLIAEKSPRKMYFYWGARDLASLYLRELPEQWARDHANFSFVPVLSDAKPGDHWAGRTGLVHQAIINDFKSLKDHDIYACGPPAMVKAAYEAFSDQGLPRDQYFSDAFEFSKDKHKT